MDWPRGGLLIAITIPIVIGDPLAGVFHLFRVCLRDNHDLGQPGKDWTAVVFLSTMVENPGPVDIGVVPAGEV